MVEKISVEDQFDNVLEDVDGWQQVINEFDGYPEELFFYYKYDADFELNFLKPLNDKLTDHFGRKRYYVLLKYRSKTIAYEELHQVSPDVGNDIFYVVKSNIEGRVNDGFDLKSREFLLTKIINGKHPDDKIKKIIIADNQWCNNKKK